MAIPHPTNRYDGSLTSNPDRLVRTTTTATATASAAHRLKGAAGTMGGDSLHYLLGEIERLGKAKDMEAVAPLAAQIEAEAAALAEMLTNEILHAPPDPFGVPFAEKV